MRPSPQTPYRQWLPFLLLVLLFWPLSSHAQQVQSLTLAASSAPGGTTVVATVTLSAVVSAQTAVTIASSQTAAATVPLVAVIPANANQTTFLVDTLPQTATTTTVISAQLGVTVNAPTLTVTPAMNQILTPTADTYVEGGSFQNRNFGVSQSLFVSTQQASNQFTNFATFFLFDLTKVTAPVTGAALRLSQSNLSTGGFGLPIGVYNVPGATFGQSTLTAANAPGLSIATWAPTGTPTPVLADTEYVPEVVGFDA